MIMLVFKEVKAKFSLHFATEKWTGYGSGKGNKGFAIFFCYFFIFNASDNSAVMSPKNFKFFFQNFNARKIKFDVGSIFPVASWWIFYDLICLPIVIIFSFFQVVMFENLTTPAGVL